MIYYQALRGGRKNYTDRKTENKLAGAKHYSHTLAADRIQKKFKWRTKNKQTENRKKYMLYFPIYFCS